MTNSGVLLKYFGAPYKSYIMIICVSDVESKSVLNAAFFLAGGWVSTGDDSQLEDTEEVVHPGYHAKLEPPPLWPVQQTIHSCRFTVSINSRPQLPFFTREPSFIYIFITKFIYLYFFALSGQL